MPPGGYCWRHRISARVFRTGQILGSAITWGDPYMGKYGTPYTCDRPASAGQSDDVTDPQVCRSPPPDGGRGPPETGSSASTGSTIPPAYLNPSGPGLERVAPRPPGQEEVHTAPLLASQWAADELSGGKRRCMRSGMPGVRTQLGCVWDHVYRRL